MAFTAAVSFARTPLEEISGKVEQIKALGWQEREDGRGDPWAASFVKEIAEEQTGQAEGELRTVIWASTGSTPQASASCLLRRACPELTL